MVLDTFNKEVCLFRLGRKAVGVEVREEYCQMSVERLRQCELQFDENGHGI